MSEIPEFKDEDEEREFWATHDSTDLLEGAEEMVMHSISEFLDKYKSELVEDGLKECQELLPQKEGNMIHFYEGSIESFERMKELSFEEIVVALEEAHQEDFRLYRLSPALDNEQLEEYWRQRGRTTQLEFVHNRLQVMAMLLDGDYWQGSGSLANSKSVEKSEP